MAVDYTDWGLAIYYSIAWIDDVPLITFTYYTSLSTCTYIMRILLNGLALASRRAAAGAKRDCGVV